MTRTQPTLPARYTIIEAHDDGVFTVEDTQLHRRCFAALLPEGENADRLLSVRQLGALEHPHILPIYDVISTDDGHPLLLSRVPIGYTLEAVLQQGIGSRAIQLDRVTGCLRIIEAVSQAHRHNIAHGAISSRCIAVGAHGETALGGWHHAQPATQEAKHRDICALADVLHHILIGKPTQRDTANSVTAPLSGERTIAPTRLLGLTLTALEALPDSCMSADEFAQHVHSALAEAQTDTWSDTSEPQRRSPPWLAIATVIVLVMTGWWLFSTNQTTTQILDFHGTSWADNWTTTYGGFEPRDGQLISTGPLLSTAFLREQLTVPFTVSLDVMMAKDALPGDCSLLWCAENPAPPGRIYDKNCYTMQIGAFDNSVATIGKMPGYTRADIQPFTLLPGQTYHLTAFVDEYAIRVVIDGITVLSHYPPSPLSNGYLGLMAYYPGKQFSALTITGGEPRANLGIAGDALASNGQFTAAAQAFERLVHLDQKWAYRAGDAWIAADELTKGQRTWATLTESPWIDLAALRLDRLLSTGRPSTEQCQRIRAGLSNDDPRIRDTARSTLLAFLTTTPPQEAAELLTIRQELLPRDPVTAERTADLLLALNQPETAQTVAAVQPLAETKILSARGQYAEILERFPNQTQAVVGALLELGEFERIYQEYAYVTWACVIAGMLDFQFEQAAAGYGLDYAGFANFRLVTDDYQQLLADPNLPINIRDLALLAADDLDELIAMPESANAEAVLYAQLLRGETPPLPANALSKKGLFISWYLALRQTVEQPHAAIDTETDAADANRIDGLAHVPAHYSQWMLPNVVQPLMRGGLSELQRNLDGLLTADSPHRAQQRPWHFAAYMRGTIDRDQFLLQPCSAPAEGLALLADGLRAECEQRPDAARTAYQAWQALPVWKRQFDQGLRDILTEALVAWRLHLLAAQENGQPVKDGQ